MVDDYGGRGGLLGLWRGVDSSVSDVFLTLQFINHGPDCLFSQILYIRLLFQHSWCYARRLPARSTITTSDTVLLPVLFMSWRSHFQEKDEKQSRYRAITARTTLDNAKTICLAFLCLSPTAPLNSCLHNIPLIEINLLFVDSILFLFKNVYNMYIPLFIWAYSFETMVK